MGGSGSRRHKIARIITHLYTLKKVKWRRISSGLLHLVPLINIISTCGAALSVRGADAR